MAGRPHDGEVEGLLGAGVRAGRVHQRPGRVERGPALAGAGRAEQQELLRRALAGDGRAQDPLGQRLAGDLDHRNEPTAAITRACTSSTEPSPATSRIRPGKRAARSR